MVSFITEATERSLLHLIFTVSVPDTSSYLMDTSGLIPTGRATGHEVDQLFPFVIRLRGNGAVPPLHQTHSWREHTDFACTFFFTQVCHY